MKIALIGNGRMGRLLAQRAPEHGFEVALQLDSAANAGGAGILAENFRGIAVAVEFTTPAAAPGNLERLAALRVPVVTGTTGWLGEMDRVRHAVESHGAGLVWSANFSVGVQVFSRIVAEAARLLREQEGYGAWAREIHHSAKKDAPSGTLLRLVEAMRATGYTRPVDQSALRAGANPGEHEIGFDSAADTITLRHTARNREGFAHGALQAARWIAERRTGFHEFGEILFGGASCS
jgi:4-hydroxy-tetrahydrodipicolinate reductase